MMRFAPRLQATVFAALLVLAACAPLPPRAAEEAAAARPTGVTIGGSTSAFYGHVR